MTQIKESIYVILKEELKIMYNKKHIYNILYMRNMPHFYYPKKELFLKLWIEYS